MGNVCKPIITIVSATLVVCLLMLYFVDNQAESFDLLNSDLTPEALGFVSGERDLAETGSTGTYYAIIIGIADYPGTINDLEYTDDDAVDVRKALLRYSNWQSSNVQLLLDSDASVTGIEQAIQSVANSAVSNDVCLFYFSGHGTNKSDQVPLDEVDGRDEFLCAYDNDISDDQLSTWLGLLPTSNVVVITDTCFSGGQIKGGNEQRSRARSFVGTNARVLRGDGFAADLIKLHRNSKDMNDNAGCIVITACDDDELSIELSSLGNGLFTYFLLLAINNYYDFNRNGSLSAEEIAMGSMWGFWVMYSRNPALRPIVGQTPQYLDDYPAEEPRSGELPFCY